MHVRPEVRDAVRQWVRVAESDFVAAEALSRLAGTPISGVVCFHSQQCVEKYLKALLTLHQVEFPKTHDLRRLVELVPNGIRVEPDGVTLIALNRFAIEERYPGDWMPADSDEAVACLELAISFRNWVRGVLPAETLTAAS